MTNWNTAALKAIYFFWVQIEWYAGVAGGNHQGGANRHTCLDLQHVHASRSAHLNNAPVNRVTLVTLVCSLQTEGQKEQEGMGGQGSGREEKLIPPLPSELIKSITSNMFLMMYKAGGS